MSTIQQIMKTIQKLPTNTSQLYSIAINKNENSPQVLNSSNTFSIDRENAFCI